MKTGMAAVRARRKRDYFLNEAKAIMENAGAVEGYKARVTTRLAKYLILNNPFVSHGKHIEIKAKSLGCGVHEVTATEGVK